MLRDDIFIPVYHESYLKNHFDCASHFHAILEFLAGYGHGQVTT